MSSKNTTAEEEKLPSREEALAAYNAALNSGQNRVRTALGRLVSAPPQVLLLEGGNARERLSVALWYAAALNCPNSHPPCLACSTCLQIGASVFNDLYLLNGNDGSIKIDEVRELRRILGEAPRGTGKRVVILAEAQALGIEAANALLKSLEEPRPDVCFLLLAPQRERLLPTLVSRSWVLTLAWPREEDNGDSLKSWLAELANFLVTGKGWLERTAAKGAIDAGMAREMVAAIQRAQIAVLSHRASSALDAVFKNLSDREHLHIRDILSQCQESLDFMVNPSLVLNWLGTQLYSVCRAARDRKASRP